MFNGCDRYSITCIDAGTQTILNPPTVFGLSFAHINVNGIDIEGRIDEMRHLFQRKPFDIIGINETKLTKDMPTNNFDIDGYELFRADMKKVGKKPGGFALYISNNVNFYEKPELMAQDLV